MPTTRSYHDACGIARALDVIGERWALLIVRELLLGPQRFSELRRALADTSANVITDRLRELEGRGVIERRKLAPPAGSWVYELSPWGRRLEPILISLGDWGLDVPLPEPPNVLSPASALLYLRGRARPDPTAPPSAVRIAVGDQVWIARAREGHLIIGVGDAAEVDAAIATDPYTFSALIGDADALEAGVAAGTVIVDGDLGALRRLFREVEPRWSALQRLSLRDACEVGSDLARVRRGTYALTFLAWLARPLAAHTDFR
jgi:DNA-binding HxlR family transcriptional regulator